MISELVRTRRLSYRGSKPGLEKAVSEARMLVTSCRIINEVVKYHFISDS